MYESCEVFGTRSPRSFDATLESNALAVVESFADVLRIRPGIRGELIGTTDRPVRLVVPGGTSFATDAEGSSVGDYTIQGRGSVGAYTLTTGLSNLSLGGRYDPKPDAARISRYRAALSLLERLTVSFQQNRQR